ncbi:MAG TPA: polysaccharide biosynthesis/export family protein, partial [Candidatus Saccharimonadales bacterium]|nr:polysaccharide biosynthesis/export family protein [Candidatus Saccharimonadales bacterium]
AFVPVPSSEMPQVHLDSGSEETGPYEVQVGDTLEVSVYGDTDLTRQVPVRPDGMISYTFVGDIRAAGRSVQEIREDIQKKLSAFLRSPEVTVIATDFSKPKVYVGGEIRQPGVFLLAPRQDTLLDAVYLAGLPTDKADVTNAVLVRDGRVVDVDFTDLLRGDLSANIKLHDNDLVYIPEAAERYIYVLGEVRRPQALETTIPLSMINVLAQSGGMDPSYAKVTEIAVLRGGLKEPRVAVVNYKRLLEGDFSQNIQVKPGDIVYVPTTGLGKYSRVIEQILRTFSLLFQWRLVAQGF